MNFLELSSAIPDKTAAFQFFQQHGIVHNPRNCVLGHHMKLYFGAQDRWRCNCRECRIDIPARKNTWLEGSHMSYRDILLLVIGTKFSEFL